MWFAYLMLLAFAITIVHSIFSKIYNASDHQYYNMNLLRPDAEIVRVKTKVVGLKNERKYRTTVVFSDGFRYVSHFCHRDGDLISYTLILSAGDKAKILFMAKEYHAKLIQKKIPDYKYTITAEDIPALYRTNGICDRCAHRTDLVHVSVNGNKKRLCIDCINATGARPEFSGSKQ